MKGKSSIMLLGIAVLLARMGISLGETVMPQADGTIYWEDARKRLTVYDDHWAADVRPADPSNHDEFRAAIEFPLQSLSDIVIRSTLRLSVLSANRYTVAGSRAAVYAYPGNGSINPGDYYATFTHGPFTDVRYLAGGLDLPMPSSEPVDVGVDVLAAVQFAQEQQWTYLGFMVCSEVGSEYFQVLLGTLETPGSTVAGHPSLLEFEVIPEPVTLSLLALGALGLMWRRHR